jgi:hypothetical protein
MHWALLACDMRYRGLDIAQEIRAGETVRSCDAWRMKGLLDELHGAENRVVLTIRPGGADNAR